MNRRIWRSATGVAVTLAVLLLPAHAGGTEHSAARQWNEATLEAIRIDIPKPTVQASKKG